MNGSAALDGAAAVEWLLAGLEIACGVVGAYLTGTSGDVHPLLVVGVGATVIGVALEDSLHGEAKSTSNDGEGSSDGNGSSDAEGST